MTKIEVKDPNILDELYNRSAFTMVGFNSDDNNINDLLNWIKQYTPMNDETVYVISGKMMNDKYHLTGDNAYPNDLTIVSIELSSISNVNLITIPRFDIGARWFDDIVDNNARRERN